MSVLHLLSATNFITVNRAVVKLVGLDAAVVLGEIASEYLYWEAHGGLEDGYFYSTVENLEDRTCLTAYEQRVALSKMQTAGWIDVKKKGMPAKRFIKLFEDKITEALYNMPSTYLTTSRENFLQQDVKNFNGNNNITNNNKPITNKASKKGDSYADILAQVPVIVDNPDLYDTFIEFIKMRKLIKAPLTDRALKMVINEAYKLSVGEPGKMRAIVEQSIRNNWKDVYPLHNSGDYARNSATNAPTSAGDIDWDKIVADAEERAKGGNKA